MEAEITRHPWINVNTVGTCGESTQVGTCMWFDHLTTANFLFVDGHVKSLKPMATVTPTNLYQRNRDVPLPATDAANILANMQANQEKYN